MEAVTTLGKYELLEHIATGGMAEIWLARQTGPAGFNKELVIKRILPYLASDEQFVRMFLDEARLAAQLSHPKIGQIYELGELDDTYFIAMEYIDGIDGMTLLEKVEARGDEIPLGIALKIISDVLEALDYAHDFTDREGNAFGLVHRDVTPHNVLISKDGIVKLVDFGVAKARHNQSKTQTGAVKGKFAYMAPEQIANKDLDRRTDIFAVGISLYELLTGIKPFGEELAAVPAILGEDPPDIRQVRPDVPTGIIDILTKALAKNKDDRYVDAHEMLREIEAVIRAEGLFVGDRELSTFIRELRGLPLTRHSLASNAVGSGPQQSPTTPSNPQPSVTPTPGEIPWEAPVTPEPTSMPLLTPSEPSPMHEPRATEQEILGPRTAQIAAEASEVFAEAREPKNFLFIAVFGAVVMMIIAAIIVIGYLVTTPTETPPTVVEPQIVSADKKKVEDKPKPKTEKEEPTFSDALRHPDGLIVLINSRPAAADLYFRGELVGQTPYRTTLRPGTYTVVARKDGRSRQKAIDVEAGRPVQTIQINFD